MNKALLGKLLVAYTITKFVAFHGNQLCLTINITDLPVRDAVRFVTYVLMCHVYLLLPSS